ncbi:DNA primase family protein [Mongoliimonas terrestris]|uniref:DNA primase family protein n=1 Tax=Mongoliimonas terrestris TaxID=1709001 RepID=UPI0009496C1F|nr:phage/plasmid primase, P4 family [Mongoliimonas terrestris]
MDDQAPDTRAAILAALADAVPVADDEPFQTESGGRGRRSGGAGGVDNAELAFLPLTDLGNAERFARRVAGRVIHVTALGWLAWDGRRWCKNGADDVVLRLVHETVRAIQDEATAIRSAGLDLEIEPASSKKPALMLSDKVAAWGRASEAAAKLKAISPHAAPYLAVRVEELDADPFVLNVENGTLRFRRDTAGGDLVQLHPHDPADRITRLAPVIYDPNATCPTYDRFLAEVQPEPDMRRFLAAWGGYSLTGDTSEQKVVFQYGSGKNGKSTLVDAWGNVAGDYGTTAAIETFTGDGRNRSGAQASPDLAALVGVRYLRTSEPERGAKLAESLIKLVTGGEQIMARELNKSPFWFRPSFKLTMSGNHRPKISGTDEGIWRRLALVPFAVQIDQPDPELGDRLKQEASGILNRLLDGLRDWMENGMPWPGRVLNATAEYREDSDPLGRFLAEATVPEVGARTAAGRMHAAMPHGRDRPVKLSGRRKAFTGH